MTIRTQADAERDLATVTANRLAGGKRYQVSVSRGDLYGLKSGENDFDIARRKVLSSPIRDCVKCAGVAYESFNDFNRNATEFRFKCGRDKPGVRVTCDDGVQVMIDRDGKAGSTYRRESEPMSATSVLSGFTADRVWIDEISTMASPSDRTSTRSPAFSRMVKAHNDHYDPGSRVKIDEKIRREKEKDKPIQADTNGDVW